MCIRFGRADMQREPRPPAPRTMQSTCRLKLEVLTGRFALHAGVKFWTMVPKLTITLFGRRSRGRMTTISQTRITCSLFHTPMDLQRARFICRAALPSWALRPRRHGIRCSRRCAHDRDVILRTTLRGIRGAAGKARCRRTAHSRPRIVLPRLDACSGRRLKTCLDPSRRMISKWLERGVRSLFVLLAGTNSCVPDAWRVNQHWNGSLRDPKSSMPDKLQEALAEHAKLKQSSVQDRGQYCSASNANAESGTRELNARTDGQEKRAA